MTTITRRAFLALLALAATGGAAALAWNGSRRRPGPLYLARHPSGVWGFTEDPEASEGALLPGARGVLGIAAGAPDGRRIVRVRDGVTTIDHEEG